jgi:cellulose 1,4-beta-cellobiosidase
MKPIHRIRSGHLPRRRGAAIVTVVALGCSALVAGVGVAPAVAAGGCTAQYVVNSDWGTGFSIAINITDNGPAITSWTLAYSYSGNQQITQGWSGNWSQSGKNVTVTNAAWNGSLGTGTEIQIGANGSYSGTNTAPAVFTLNGAQCNGSGGGNTVTVTSPGNQSGTVGTAASVQMSASDSASGQAFTWSASGLPGGLSVNSASGLISGTPNAAGTFTVSVTATDTTGAAGSVSFTWTIAAATGNTVTVTGPGNQTGTVGAAVSLQIKAADSASGQTLTYAATGLPAGLSISSSTGLISGTPTTAATSDVTVAATDTTGASGSATFTWTISTSGGGGGSILIDPSSFSVPEGGNDAFGVSLAAAPSGNVTVNVARTSGNTGLSVSAGGSLTFTTSNWMYPQPVTVSADSSSTGSATFTASASGLTSVTTSGTETTAGSTTTPSHVVNPFTGSTWYVNPDYTAEVATSVAQAGGTLAAQMKLIGQQPTGIWLDHIGAIYGGTDNNSRMSLEAQMNGALSQESGTTPILIPIVIYDLPNRDCAALASNGELTISNNGLQYYEQDYINPIAQILTNFEHTNIRVIAVIEPDSLPNLVTNTSIANCAQAQSSGAYVTGIQYALNKLHAIPNVYNYIDIAHSAWLGWPSNMGPAVSLFHSVAAGTTAGVASVDGFISNTANYTPTSEPYMTATESVDGNPVDSVQYYSFDPYIDELTYDEAMYQQLVSAGFPSTIGMLIDTSRNGWGGPNRPTGACSTTTCTTTTSFVNASKIDERPFRGDWCNQNNAGLGAFPQANPISSFPNLYATVWIKPPGESDGDYPSGSHTHGDPHCDPNGTNTDGSGNTYPTNSIPGYDIPAGQWFPAEFQMLVQNAYPAVP